MMEENVSVTREDVGEALLALVEHGDFRQLTVVGLDDDPQWKITMFGFGGRLATYEGATIKEVLTKWQQRESE